MNNMRNGRMYRVSGASSVTGEEVEILVEAHDEADAARAANRQGVFVSGCAPAGADGSNWAAKARDAGPANAGAPAAAAPAADRPAPAASFSQSGRGGPVGIRLVRAFPQLDFPVKRLDDDDRKYLANLSRAGLGVSAEDAAHVRQLMRNPGRLK
jgi:hypothetical protein